MAFRARYVPYLIIIIIIIIMMMIIIMGRWTDASERIEQLHRGLQRRGVRPPRPGPRQGAGLPPIPIRGAGLAPSPHPPHIPPSHSRRGTPRPSSPHHRPFHSRRGTPRPLSPPCFHSRRGTDGGSRRPPGSHRQPVAVQIADDGTVKVRTVGGPILLSSS